MKTVYERIKNVIDIAYTRGEITYYTYSAISTYAMSVLPSKTVSISIVASCKQGEGRPVVMKSILSDACVPANSYYELPVNYQRRTTTIKGKIEAVPGEIVTIKGRHKCAEMVDDIENVYKVTEFGTLAIIGSASDERVKRAVDKYLVTHGDARMIDPKHIGSPLYQREGGTSEMCVKENGKH